MPQHRNREEIVQALTGIFDLTAHHLAESGASDLEVGRAMVATGLSHWARAVSAEQLIDELCGITSALAADTLAIVVYDGS
ncbi:hypothetical protein [Methylobacterium oryzisoli]|uniref:hypothetical protein n=1 Tax=Methylobacterium oryzisoli TaxID=3385502 RepID=UPI003891FBBA